MAFSCTSQALQALAPAHAHKYYQDGPNARAFPVSEMGTPGSAISSLRHDTRHSPDVFLRSCAPISMSAVPKKDYPHEFLSVFGLSNEELVSGKAGQGTLSLISHQLKQ